MNQSTLTVTEVIEAADGKHALCSDGALYPLADELHPGDRAMIAGGRACMWREMPPVPGDVVHLVVSGTTAVPAVPPDMSIVGTPTIDIVLDSAAAGAAPNQAPQPEPALEDVVQQLGLPSETEIAERRARIYAEGRAAEYLFTPLYSLDAARALPEAPGGCPVVPLTSTDEREITAFKDDDGRTMLVVLGGNGLCKSPHVRITQHAPV